MTGGRQRILEVLHLTVQHGLRVHSDYRRPLWPALLLQAAEQRQRRIVKPLHREHDLVVRIILAQGAAEIALEIALKSVDRLQHGDGGRLACTSGSHLVSAEKEEGGYQCRNIKKRSRDHWDQQQGFDDAHELSGLLRT